MSHTPSQQELLAQCANEPIQWLGRTQAFGFLLAFDPHDRKITHCSGNAPAWTGCQPRSHMSRSVESVLPKASVDAACAHAQVARARGGVRHLHRVGWPGREESVDITIHDSQGQVVIEAEPHGEAPPHASRVIEQALLDLASPVTLHELAGSAVQAIAQITGYSRVMFYRFSSDGSGTVVAEHLGVESPSYLGLRYPASDIPAQARRLYLLNPIRIIANVSDEGTPLVSAASGAMDLSLAVTRSVSPVHLAYLRNMGTAATMSISLVVRGTLWGMIACHHPVPRRPPLSCRSLADQLGRLYGMAIDQIERGHLDSEVKALFTSSAGLLPLLDSPAASPQFAAASATVAQLFEASGLACSVDGQVRVWGKVPRREALETIARTVAATNDAPVKAIESLPELSAELRPLLPDVAGAVYLPLSPRGIDWLMLLRDEVRQHVRWAGDPGNTVGYQQGRLTPRGSFAAWEAQVRDHCEPWRAQDMELAGLLRSRLVDLQFARREQRELQSALRLANQQSLLVRELNHRVRNMLSLVKGMVHQSARTSSTVEELATRLHDRVHSMARAYAQVDRAHWQAASLTVLATEEAGGFGQPGQVALSGPPISLEATTYLAVSMVIHELCTNAAKYGALSVPSGKVELTWHIDTDGWLQLQWQESGGPPVTTPKREGFGSRVIREAVRHQLRGRSTIEFHPQGMKVRVGLPAGFCAGAPPEPTTRREAPEPIHQPGVGRALVVDDDVVIAMLTESMLLQFGCEQVVLAGSADEAIRKLDEGRFDVAVLDVNLGGHDSDAIASKLAALHIPAVVATAYSENDDIPPGLRALRRITKPYSTVELSRALSEVLTPRSGALADGSSAPSNQRRAAASRRHHAQALQETWPEAACCHAAPGLPDPAVARGALLANRPGAYQPTVTVATVGAAVCSEELKPPTSS